METPRKITDRKVLDWLGLDSRGVPYYLNSLNLVWSDSGVEHDLKVFRGVADLLATDPNYWAEIIRERSWRHCLAACTCLLVSKRHEFCDDLSYRFREGSFVAPQIAVAIGLLHKTFAQSFFESLLDDQSVQQSPKQIVSAHRVLLRLGVHSRRDVSIDSWTGFERDEAMIADKVVEQHWNFWSGRVE